MTNTNTPPRRWHIRVQKYMNATDYDIMCGEECFGAFRSTEQLKDFADLLQGDLDAGRAMTTETRESYAEIIAEIHKITEGAA